MAIITFNEQHNLARTLAAIKPIADEIVVVDSNSTDGTRSIARDFKARIFKEDFKGHIAQKNSALDKCTMDWILAIDADEVVDKTLASAIREAVKQEGFDGFKISRKSIYLGKTINYMWQPDIHLRLVRRAATPSWGGYDPHDKLFITSGSGKIGKLNGILQHYSYRNLNDHWNKTVKYAHISAESYAKMGRRFRLYKLLFSPLFAFLKNYIFRGGFIDGIRGVFAASSQIVSIFLKYAFLWEIEHRKKQHHSKKERR
ncbi:glycosyl transferase [Campylobacterota bacterium]|nr:glycosyl transferase [Campylobacterota bacterium]